MLSGEVQRGMISKVPAVTAFFWAIKVMATTVGETAADFVSAGLGFGLAGASVTLGAVAGFVMLLQFSRERYVPAIYWLAVVMISITGTLITDLMVDEFGVSLIAATLGFAAGLAAVFALWWRAEGTLSIHKVNTARREGFYWLAILLTFALGTAAGDLLAEGLGLGYAGSGLIFFAAIALIAHVHYAFSANGVLCFWLVYILTRPLGASLGDYLSQPVSGGGLGFGPMVASGGFLALILALVFWLSVSGADQISARPSRRLSHLKES